MQIPAQRYLCVLFILIKRCRNLNDTEDYSWLVKVMRCLARCTATPQLGRRFVNLAGSGGKKYLNHKVHINSNHFRQLYCYSCESLDGLKVTEVLLAGGCLASHVRLSDLEQPLEVT